MKLTTTFLDHTHEENVIMSAQVTKFIKIFNSASTFLTTAMMTKAEVAKLPEEEKQKHLERVYKGEPSNVYHLSLIHI